MGGESPSSSGTAYFTVNDSAISAIGPDSFGDVFPDVTAFTATFTGLSTSPTTTTFSLADLKSLFVQTDASTNVTNAIYSMFVPFTNVANADGYALYNNNNSFGFQFLESSTGANGYLSNTKPSAFRPNLYFASITGGYVSSDTTSPGSPRISGQFIGAGTATTNSFNPQVVGLDPNTFKDFSVVGTIFYSSNNDPNASVVAQLLSNGSPVQTNTLASGLTFIAPNTPFTTTFNVTPAIFNSQLAVRFVGTGNVSSGHDFEVVQTPLPPATVPEPSNILGLGSVTALGFIAFFKRKLKN